MLKIHRIKHKDQIVSIKDIIYDDAKIKDKIIQNIIKINKVSYLRANTMYNQIEKHKYNIYNDLNE